jgi:hypothetical protein
MCVCARVVCVYVCVCVCMCVCACMCVCGRGEVVCIMSGLKRRRAHYAPAGDGVEKKRGEKKRGAIKNPYPFNF